MANLKLQNKNYVYNELTDNGKKIVPDSGFDGLGKVKIRSRWHEDDYFFGLPYYLDYPFTNVGWGIELLSSGANNEAFWLDKLVNGELRFELRGDIFVGQYDEERKWTQVYARKITSAISNEVEEILSGCECGGSIEDFDYIIKFVSNRPDTYLNSRTLYFVHFKDWGDNLCFYLIGAYYDGYNNTGNYITYNSLFRNAGFHFDITTFWLDDKLRGPMLYLDNDTIVGDCDDWVPNAVRYNLYNLEPCSSSDFQTVETLCNNYEATGIFEDTSIDGTSLNTESGDGIALVFDIMALGLGTTICAPHAYKFALINSDFVENGFNIYYTQDLNETNKYTVIPPNSQDMGTYGWWNGDSSTVMIFWKYDAIDALGIDDIAQAPILLSNWHDANTKEELSFTGLSSGIYTVTAVDKDGNESGIYNVVANGMEELNI